MRLPLATAVIPNSACVSARDLPLGRLYHFVSWQFANRMSNSEHFPIGHGKTVFGQLEHRFSHNLSMLDFDLASMGRERCSHIVFVFIL